MRDIVVAIVIGIGTLMLCLGLALSATQYQDRQLHNPYWPFTVEIQVRDK